VTKSPVRRTIPVIKRIERKLAADVGSPSVNDLMGSRYKLFKTSPYKKFKTQ
jgi:hypothetical protein